ncbi:MAG: DNA primase [Candidatus Marinimicrobia bacterium]|nr:DNA primase [Candidatus Neomarinimicrobiota bacterium]
MAFIKEDSINKVKQRIGLVDIISDYVHLKQRGNDFKGLCPFHDEKTPSFSVNENKSVYKCFGCGVSGTSVFNFVMQQEKLTYPESIEFLAKRAGIELEYDKTFNSELKNLTSEILEIHKIASDLFMDNIKKNDSAKNYLFQRGFDDNVLTKFQIGLSINSYDQLLKVIQNKKKFSSKSMLNSGLFINASRGYIDKFRNRIMFPIHNHNGEIVAFTGRTRDSNNKAKYINSPETRIFKKGNLFYGLWSTNQSILREKYVVIVEGQTDFLKLFQKGMTNIIATSGTAFTDNQAKLVYRKTNKAYILYDGDLAGMAAATKAGYMLMKYNVDTKIVEIPKSSDGKAMDPDEWSSRDSIERIRSKIINSLDVLDFHFKYYDSMNMNDENNIKDSKIGITKFINECLNQIKEINDPVYQELQINRLSELTNVTNDSILRLFRSIENKSSSSKDSQNLEPELKSKLNNKLDDDVIKLCFTKKKEIRLFISENLEKSWFQNNNNANIYESIFIHLSSEQYLDSDSAISLIKNKNEKKHLIDLIFEMDEKNLSLKMAKECISRMKKRFYSQKIELMRASLKVSSDNDDTVKIINKINTLQKQINGIK